MYRTPAQRFAAAAPLAVFLLILGIASWAGRNELKAAIEASGAFVAAQFGQVKRGGDGAAPTVAPTATLATTAPATAAPVTAAPATTAPSKAPAQQAAASKPKVIVEIDDKGRKLQILDVPIPEDCHPQQNADYAGDGVVWGLGHKKASAAECCAACKEHQKTHPDRPCNVWVWCGDPSGVCWTMDIHNHTTGDCWLKYQEKWDNNPDRSKSNLEINHQGKFPADFRAVHKTAPELVPWVAGAVPIKKARRLRRGV